MHRACIEIHDVAQYQALIGMMNKKVIFSKGLKGIYISTALDFYTYYLF